MLSICVCSLSLCLSRLGVMHVSQRSSLMVSHLSVFSHQQIVKVETVSGFGLGRCPVNRRRHHKGGGRPVKGIRIKNYYPEGVENFLFPLTETGGKSFFSLPPIIPLWSFLRAVRRLQNVYSLFMIFAAKIDRPFLT